MTLSKAAYKRWFLAAAAYNALWGTWTVLFPRAFFHLIATPPPEPIAIWQCVGMMVLVYSGAYALVALQPERYAGLAWIGFVGKLLGPLGFLWAALQGMLPWSFGWTNLTNDVIWLPVFALFLSEYGRKPLDGN